MSQIFYTNSGYANFKISNVILSSDFAYLNAKATASDSSIPVKLGTLTKDYQSLGSTTTIKFTLNNDLPSDSSNPITYVSYTLSVYPTWYGDSKTYTDGNEVSYAFEIRQNNHISGVTSNTPYIWASVSQSGSGGAGTTNGTAGTAQISYAKTSTAYIPTTTITSSNTGAATISGTTVTAASGSGTSTITVTSDDGAGSSGTTTITTINPTLTIKGASTITPTGSTTVDISDCAEILDDIEYSATNATVVKNADGSVTVTGDGSGSPITLTASYGTGGVYGTRTIVIGVASANPVVITPTSANTGDTVNFELTITAAKLEGVDTDVAGTTLTDAQIASAFSLKKENNGDAEILSGTVTSDGTKWTGVLHLTKAGKVNVGANYVGSSAASYDAEGVTVEDITLEFVSVTED